MKYVIILCLIFLIACTTVTPTPAEIEIVAATSTAVSIPTSAPTPAPTQTAPFAPTLTPVATSVPLSEITARLAESSRRYIAQDESQAIKIAQALDFLGENGHPANMCGPLSAAQLRDVGLIPSYVNLHDFWLLDPRDHRYILDQNFPPEYFTDTFFETPINRFDFSEFPLQVGDFVYIYQGDEGNFEHMLVVTRVDEQGRAYSVTNIHTWDDQYLILDALLYDPQNVGVGWFYAWTKHGNPIDKVTGYGGFEVWRPIKAPRMISDEEKAFSEQVDALFKDVPSARILITRDKDVLYARASRQLYSSDAALNLPIALFFFAALEDTTIPPAEYQSYLRTTGYDNALQRLMTRSDPDAAVLIRDYIRASQLDWRATLARWGASATDLDYQRTTAADLETLLRGLYNGTLLDPEARQGILSVMPRSDGVYYFPIEARQVALIDSGHVYTVVVLGGNTALETVIDLLINNLISN